MKSQLKQFFILVLLIVISDRVLSPYLQFLGGFRILLLAGLSTWLVHAYYTRRNKGRAAETDKDGVRFAGDILLWKNVDRIEFNGGKARLFTANGGREFELSFVQAEASGEFNDIAIEANDRGVLSRLPESGNARIYIAAKVSRLVPRIFWSLLSLFVVVFFLMFCYFLQDAMLYMILFGIAALYFARGAIDEFAGLSLARKADGAKSKPLTVVLTEDGLNYQRNGVNERLAWSDISGVRLVYHIKSATDLGFTVLTTASRRQMVFPFLSIKIKDVIVKAAGLTKKRQGGRSEYYEA